MLKYKILKAIAALACFSLIAGMLLNSMPTVLGGIAIGVATLLAHFDEPPSRMPAKGPAMPQETRNGQE